MSWVELLDAIKWLIKSTEEFSEAQEFNAKSRAQLAIEQATVIFSSGGNDRYTLLRRKEKLSDLENEFRYYYLACDVLIRYESDNDQEDAELSETSQFMMLRLAAIIEKLAKQEIQSN